MKRIAAEICKKRYDVVTIVFLYSYISNLSSLSTITMFILSEFKSNNAINLPLQSS